jgi:hypothetical protein
MQKKAFFIKLKNVLNIKDQLFYIPVLMASTGSNFEAVRCKIPDIKPIKAANPVPKKYITHSRTNSKSKP